MYICTIFNQILSFVFFYQLRAFSGVILTNEWAAVWCLLDHVLCIIYYLEDTGVTFWHHYCLSRCGCESSYGLIVCLICAMLRLLQESVCLTVHDSMMHSSLVCFAFVRKPPHLNWIVFKLFIHCRGLHFICHSVL